MQSRPALYAALGALCLSGCVSMGKYKALEALNTDLKSQLDLTKTSAQSLQGDLGEAAEEQRIAGQGEERP